MAKATPKTKKPASGSKGSKGGSCKPGSKGMMKGMKY